MSKLEEYDLHPTGWENDPEEERFKMNTLDYLTTTTWANMALFFEVEESKKAEVLDILKKGVEQTLSQVRHYVGTIEKDPDGDHSIVRKKTSTVKFTVKHLDGPKDMFPSMSEIARANFSQDILGDHDVLSHHPMTFGRKPEAHPDNSPELCSFRANMIPGGIIFMSAGHHYANGVGGWSSFCQQIGENCYAVTKGLEMPFFDPRCLDRSMFTSLGNEKPTPAQLKESQERPKPIAPPGSEDQSQRKPLQSVFFHLPNSKAAVLKKAASPMDGTWISTYDAVCGFMWRVFSRIREPLYQPGPDFLPLLGTGVSMKRFDLQPPMPDKMQGNIQFDVTSATSPVPRLTLAEVISEAPLSKLATYVRQLTGSVTLDMIAERLQSVAHVQNKPDLSISVDTMPPLAQYITDWRGVKVTTFDFGFAKPIAYRNLFSMVLGSHCIVYPPRNRGPAGDDEGIELQVTFEEDLVKQLVDDPEWSKYFEFRGVDLWEEGRKPYSAKL